MNILRGIAAGLAATVPMTIAMHALRMCLPKEEWRPMPPREIVDRTIEKAGEGDDITESDRRLITSAAHFTFGALAGGMYGALLGSRRQSTWTGVGYGVAVWAVAYGVGLPSLDLHPAPLRDTKDRNELLIASHIVWGAALGALCHSGTLRHDT